MSAVARDWSKYRGWRLVRQIILDRVASHLILFGLGWLSLGKRVSPDVWRRVMKDRL